MKYIVVGGKPFTGYTGTLTYTGLKIVGKTDDAEEASSMCKDNWDECGGLFLVIDTETGEASAW